MSLPSLQKYHKDTYSTIDPSRPELSQTGKTIVVAGGSTGIGFAISRSFSLAHASRVIILGRRPDVNKDAASKIQLESSSSTIVEARAVDISSIGQISKLWSDLESEKIYVDTLVLSASAYGKVAPILDMGSETAWADFEANVRAPLYMTEHFYKQKTGKGQKYLVNISTIAAYMWQSMGPERPTYGLTKNSATLLLQQIAKDTSPDDMQVVSFHPGGVLSESSRKLGVSENSGIRFDHENLPGHTAVWAASKEARFLHGRFVLANWDMDEVRAGVVGKQIQDDANFLKIGVEGLSENMGGIIF